MRLHLPNPCSKTKCGGEQKQHCLELKPCRLSLSLGKHCLRFEIGMQIKKQSTIVESYAECDDLIDQFRRHQLPLTAGCDMEGSLEAKVTGVLNNIREAASKAGF